jgi:hypothetical protein
VVGPLNVSSIGYWQMYGINMLFQMFLTPNTVQEDDRWNRALTMLYVCVPPEKVKETDEVLEEQNEKVWVKAGTFVFAKLVGNTIVLGIGWAVHTFLA